MVPDPHSTYAQKARESTKPSTLSNDIPAQLSREQIWFDLPAAPLGIQLSPSKRDVVFSNRSTKTIVQYRLGCVRDRDHPRVLRKLPTTKTQLELGGMLINAVSLFASDAERCMQKTAKLAVVRVVFDNDSSWRIESPSTIQTPKKGSFVRHTLRVFGKSLANALTPGEGKKFPKRSELNGETTGRKNVNGNLLGKFIAFDKFQGLSNPREPIQRFVVEVQKGGLFVERQLLRVIYFPETTSLRGGANFMGDATLSYTNTWTMRVHQPAIASERFACRSTDNYFRTSDGSIDEDEKRNPILRFRSTRSQKDIKFDNLADMPCLILDTVRVPKEEPGVYLRVELRDEKKVLLRMYNDTKGAVAVRTFTFYFNRKQSIDLGDGKSVFALPGGEEIDSLHYYVEKEPTAPDDLAVPKLFHGDSSSVSWIPSNGSILFSVPIQQIEPGLILYVPFHYQSELNEQLIFNNKPEHRAYFRGVDLSKAAATRPR